jgi:hypothetical protein
MTVQPDALRTMLGKASVGRGCSFLPTATATRMFLGPFKCQTQTQVANLGIHPAVAQQPGALHDVLGGVAKLMTRCRHWHAAHAGVCGSC